jgi:hypothetical protein
VLELHYRDSARRDQALALLSRAIVIGETSPTWRPVLVGEVS